MTQSLPRVAPLGDAAVTITFGDETDQRARGLVLTLKRALDRHPPPGTIELVAASTTLTIHYDPLEIDYLTLKQTLARELPSEPAEQVAASGRLIEVPVRYDGPDLEDVARQTGLATDEVVKRHVSRTYEALFLGFVPGFAYLGDLDRALELPRRPTPRKRVPAGSVAIAGNWTGIYPAETPGGWHLIGRTDVRLFDAERQPAALIEAGDLVRFVEVTP